MNRRLFSFGIMEPFDFEFKPDFVLPKKRLRVTNEKICWGEDEIYFSKITRVRYGATALIVWIFPVKTIYQFIIDEGSGKRSKLFFVKNRLVNYKTGEKIYDLLVDVLYEKVVTRLAQTYLDKIYNNERVELAKCEIDEQGLYYKQWLFGYKEHYIAWNDVVFQTEPGVLIIYSKAKKDIMFVRSFKDHWGTWELYYILNNIELDKLTVKRTKNTVI